MVLSNEQNTTLMCNLGHSSDTVSWAHLHITFYISEVYLMLIAAALENGNQDSRHDCVYYSLYTKKYIQSN